MSSEIRDINLAESGERKIEWVKRNCDLLRTLEKEFSETKPFAGKKIALSVHLEAKTAYLCKVLKAGGAEMYVTGSNPLSTQDDVAACMHGMIAHRKNMKRISATCWKRARILLLTTEAIWSIWCIPICRN